MYRRLIVLTGGLWFLGIGLFVIVCLQQSNEVTQTPAYIVTGIVSEHTAVNFPCRIPGTDLTALGLFPYDGPFWEDGSGREVVGVTALLLENTGNYGIESANIVFCQGERLLKFAVDTIPPGARVVVPEQGRAVFSEEGLDYCYGTQWLQLDGWDLSSLEMSSPTIGTLEVKNITNKKIEEMQLLYKDYLQGMYVGGTTNYCTISEIEPGETVVITPDRFAAVSSKVLCVLTK